MTNTLSRILKRDKPKADIIENMTRTFFMNTSGSEAIISIKPKNMTRSGSQNALYWHIIEQVRVESGNTKDAIHKFCQLEFLETRIEEVAKKPIEVVKSTTSLSTKEMGVYLDEVITWASNDLGIRLNLPDEWRGLVVE